jgi:hypothetical protein
MRNGHDPRAELLVILGGFCAAGGIATVFLLGTIKRVIPNITGAFLLLAFGTLLTIGGIWLARRRRWAGILIAAASLLAAGYYLVGLTRCMECTTGTMVANVAIALMVGVPGVAIVRWRRFLR